jgi:hypothetical protein
MASRSTESGKSLFYFENTCSGLLGDAVGWDGSPDALADFFETETEVINL